MPKLKTHKGAQSRFKITGSGKIMRTKGPKTHFRTRKSKRVKGALDEMIELNSRDRRRIRRLIPYGVK
jgi:large subunit ribosomal protein L35